MAEPSLDGCFEKCKRAWEHFETFDAEARAWLHLRPYRISGQFEPKTNEYVFHVHLTAADPRLSVLVGEIIHNLRSSLEHLVGQLVLVNGKPLKAGRDGQGFPVLKKKPTKSFDEATRHKLSGVSGEARAEVEAVQFYKRGNAPKSDPLIVLDYLWNSDKHQSLLTTNVSTQIDMERTTFNLNADAGRKLSVTWRPLAGGEDGAEIARLTLDPQGPKPYVYMDAHVTLEVALRGGAPAIEALQLLCENVVGVLKRFERFF